MTQEATQRPTPSGADFEVPSGRSFVALLEAFRATRGTAPADVVGRLLQERQIGNTVSLGRLISAGCVFGFVWRAGLWIPMFQFDAETLALRISAQRVRAELPKLWSGWAVASWFAAASARLEGRSPVDALDANPDAVLQMARSIRHEHIAPPLAAGRRPHEAAAHV